MTYTLHFLPDVEEDVIAGYSWYEGKSAELGEDFLRVFYASVMRSLAILFFIQKSIKKFVVGYSEDFH